MPALLLAAPPLTLAWDANDPAPQGYHVFQREEGQGYNYTQWIYEGTQANCTLNNLDDSVTYYFVVRAFSGEDQSGDSNEISYRYDPPEHGSYTITATAGTGGSISPSGSVDVEEGQSRSFTISASDGYRISDVLVNGDSRGDINSYTFDNVTANNTIEARFEAVASQSHTITATAGSGGSISPSGSVAVEEGQSRSFTISASDGYRISDVLVNGDSRGDINSYTFDNVTANNTIEARFEAVASQSHTITATAGSGGSISPSGSVDVEEGQSRSFTISASDGYRISDVLVNGDSRGDINSYTFDNVTANNTIEARFEAVASQSHTITATAGSGGSISPSGSVAVEEGQSRSFTISASDGYRISDVLVNGDSRGDINSYTFDNVTANNTIEVQFTNTPVDPDEPIIIDDGDAGTSHTGNWSVSSGVNPYGTQSLYSNNSGDTYTYQANLTGQYELYVWWTEHSNRCDNVGIEVNDNDTLMETIDVNQQQDGGQWNYLGFYDFNGTARVVVVSDSTNCSASADAVQFVLNDENQAPDQPVLTYPADGDNGVTLSPKLYASAFNDPDQDDSHLKTQWRIQTDSDRFTVLDITSNPGHLTDQKVPPHVLDPETTYIVQVRYYDNRDLPSKWSDPVAFTTEADRNDTNQNRIPDSQEVSDTTDLNNDNIPDGDQAEVLKRFKTYNSEHIVGLSVESSDTVASIVAAADIAPSDLDLTPPPEEEMSHGMFSYKIHIAEPGQTASVRIFFSDPIDAQALWVSYDSSMELTDCSTDVDIDPQGYSAVRNLVDGGEGDLDGTANGVIVDAAAPMDESESDHSLGDKDSTAESGDSSSSSSCFIQSLY